MTIWLAITGSFRRVDSTTRLETYSERTRLTNCAVLGVTRPHDLSCLRMPTQPGPGREVEHNLAKVGVEGSNPFARSKICWYCKSLRAYGASGPFSFWLRKHLGSTEI